MTEIISVIVGLINYPRFPAAETIILQHAIELAGLLRIGLKQESFTIQNKTDTHWYSWREADQLCQ